MGNAEKGQSVDFNQKILDIYGGEMLTGGSANTRLGEMPNGPPMTLGYAVCEAFHSTHKGEEEEAASKTNLRVEFALSLIKDATNGKVEYQPAFNMDQTRRKEVSDRVHKQWRHCAIIHKRVCDMLKLVEA